MFFVLATDNFPKMWNVIGLEDRNISPHLYSVSLLVASALTGFILGIGKKESESFLVSVDSEFGLLLMRF